MPWPWTIALIKPDAVRRRLVGTIVHEIETRGFEIRAAGVVGGPHAPDRAAIEEFYAEHKGRPYFEPLIAFMSSGPFWALELAAPTSPDVVAAWRAAMGPSAHARRQPGQIRYELAGDAPEMENLVHGSDSEDAARREAKLLYGLEWL
jgi:nucleoside-diphosphate kinase